MAYGHDAPETRRWPRSRSRSPLVRRLVAWSLRRQSPMRSGRNCWPQGQVALTVLPLRRERHHSAVWSVDRVDAPSAGYGCAEWPVTKPPAPAKTKTGSPRTAIDRPKRTTENLTPAISGQTLETSVQKPASEAPTALMPTRPRTGPEPREIDAKAPATERTRQTTAAPLPLTAPDQHEIDRLPRSICSPTRGAGSPASKS